MVVLAPELRDDERDTIELFKRNSDAVVHITNTARVRSALRRDPIDYPVGSGTGIVWDAGGHIVTNHHVIAPATERTTSRYFVRFAGDDSEYEAAVVASAPHRDIAVLRLVARDRVDVRPIALGRSADLQVGQKVFAIGNPFGLDQTLTTGIISGLNREIRSQSNHKIAGVIQTDAAINPGNSGGPLLDSAGRLIGVNTAIVSPSGAYAGIGFAVPIDTVRRVVAELIEHGVARRPGLGVTLVDDATSVRYGLTGVGVMEVHAGTAAEDAGLRSAQRTRAGELLVDEIVGVDGVPIRTQENLLDALDAHVAGDTVRLAVRRDGRVLEVPVRLQWLE
jgi:S1-C subfamily serine protease